MPGAHQDNGTEIHAYPLREGKDVHDPLEVDGRQVSPIFLKFLHGAVISTGTQPPLVINVEDDGLGEAKVLGIGSRNCISARVSQRRRISTLR